MITQEQLKSFTDHIVWKYFKSELEAMRMNVLENLANEEDINKIRMMQGMQQVLLDMAKWPEMQLELILNEGEINDVTE